LKEAVGFLKIPTRPRTKLAADTRPADGEFLQAAVNRQEFLKFRERAGMPTLFKRDGQHFKPEKKTEIKKTVQGMSI